MEHKHQKAIDKLFGSGYARKVVVLNIPDRFSYGSVELVEILEERVSLV